MTVEVFAAPAPPPVPPVNPWTALAQTWTGWDGSVWDLSGQGSGVRLNAGVRGFTLPPSVDYLDESAGVDGQRLRGYRVRAREPFWPVKVYHDAGSQAWLDHDAAFARTLQPGRYGTWTVTTASGHARTLRMRCVDDGGLEWRNSPGLVGWAIYGVRFVADDPYWYGLDVLVPGGPLDTAPFIGAGGAPPFWVAGGSPLAGMSITNPGEVPAWPVWEATGPHPDLVVGIGSLVIECPPLTAGESLVLDTSPWVRTALVDGVDVTDELGAAEFAPIPAGQDLALSVSSSGDGTVACRLRPRYYRAW